MKFARRNHSLDAVCSVIGIAATQALIDWRGGTNICVPNKVIPGHPLGRIIGPRAFYSLVSRFGGQFIWVPKAAAGRYAAADERMRTMAALLREGVSPRDVAEKVGVTVRHVQRYRAALREIGMRV